MANPFVGEIRMAGFNFPPQGWALCQGQLLPISQNSVLFNLIGTTYGGDGINTFALPDLQGRAPVHVGPTMPIGAQAGEETVPLSSSQIPAHSHALNVASSSSTASPANALIASAPIGVGYSFTPSATPAVAMSGASVGPSGSGVPHDNMQPFVVVNFIISLFGVYPSRS